MLELTEWARSASLPDRPWLVVGKGPTFDRRGEFDLTGFNTMGLNHVVDRMAVDVAHAIDVEVVGSCGDRLAANCRWLLMPRRPNVDHQRDPRLLEDHFADYPVLRELDEQGRLVWYNLLGSKPEGSSPVIGVRYFSGEAAIGILARIGARKIRSLGLDGGRAYAGSFGDLAGRTLLANGYEAFDIQFRQIQLIVDEHGIDYGPLVEPLRVFIGTEPSHVVAHRVLEYSIRKSASVPVEIVPMLGLKTPMPKDAANRPATEFSFCRFLIPSLCNYRGRAVYVDADMLVFGDVAELAEVPFGGAKVLCTNQAEPPAAWAGNPAFHPGRHTAVMVLDCERLDWDVEEIVAGLDAGQYTYSQLMSELCILGPGEISDTLPVEWNHLERYEPGVTRLLHYTVAPTQPWRNDENPLADIWMTWYREAVEAGAVPPEEVEALIAAGHVKRSLAAALALAPNRRSVLTGASLDLATARLRIAKLEAELAALRSSWPVRLGRTVSRPLRRARTVARRGLATARGR
ncbi:MAG: hypothetical protein AB1673_14115 [Actinomycetota bacterium]